MAVATANGTISQSRLAKIATTRSTPQLFRDDMPLFAGLVLPFLLLLAHRLRMQLLSYLCCYCFSYCY